MLAREWNTPSRDANDAAGTHIPFTAPLLSGVCVRPNRDSLDFLLPNPSGGRGTYVVSWSSVAEYASPTLHDTMLAGGLTELGSLDPASVRAAAQDIALQGYAGRLAADAATRRKARLETERLQLWSRLLTALIDASTLAGAERTLFLQGLGRAGPGVMTVGLNALARRLQWEPATLFDGLGRLSASYTPLARNGRVAILLAHFEQLRADVARELGRLQIDREQAHGREDAGEDGSDRTAQALPLPLKRLLPDLDHCLRHGHAVANAATRSLEHPAALLEGWRIDPAIPLELVERVERALDGWDRIALLWRDSRSPSARTAVLPEIALLLRLAADRIRIDDPSPEAARHPGRDLERHPPRDLADTQAPTDADRPGERHPASGNRPGRAASVPALVERNERIRALELDLEGGNG